MYERKRPNTLKRALIWGNILVWGTMVLAFILPPILRNSSQISRSGIFASKTATADPSIVGTADQIQAPPAATTAPPALGYERVVVPQGILQQYEYTQRVVYDEGVGGYRAATREQPDVNLPGQWPVTSRDKVAIVDTVTNEQGRWYKIVLVESAVDPRYNGNTGYILAWLIDNTGVPPIPTEAPTVEATALPEPTPTVEEQPVTEPEPTQPADIFQPREQPVLFNKETRQLDEKTEGKGCIRGEVKLHQGGVPITVSFQQGNDFRTADVDSNGAYRICDLSAGTWAAVVFKLNNHPYRDSDSSLSVQVSDGQVSLASWYQQ